MTFSELIAKIIDTCESQGWTIEEIYEKCLFEKPDMVDEITEAFAALGHQFV